MGEPAWERCPANPAEGRSSVSTEQRENLEAILRQSVFPVDSDVSEPEFWVPPSHVLECPALLETYLDLREQRTGVVRRINAVLFRHGVPHIAG